MSGGALRLVWIHLVAYIRAVNTMGVSKFRRGRIQEESMFLGAPDKSCEKHHGSLPLVSVNTLPPKEHAGDIVTAIELIRSTEKEKGQQIANVHAYQRNRNHARVISVEAAPAATESGTRLTYLQDTARDRKNVLAADCAIAFAMRCNATSMIKTVLR